MKRKIGRILSEMFRNKQRIKKLKMNLESQWKTRSFTVFPNYEKEKTDKNHNQFKYSNFKVINFLAFSLFFW